MMSTVAEDIMDECTQMDIIFSLKPNSVIELKAILASEMTNHMNILNRVIGTVTTTGV